MKKLKRTKANILKHPWLFLRNTFTSQGITYMIIKAIKPNSVNNAVPILIQ